MFRASENASAKDVVVGLSTDIEPGIPYNIIPILEDLISNGYGYDFSMALDSASSTGSSG